MTEQNIDTNSQPKKWQSWLILFLRWFVGSFAGVGISSCIYFGLKNDTFTGPFLWVLEMLPILSVPFVGHIYLFYPGTNSYLHVNDFFTLFPVLIWGLIGALLASGRKEQIRIGTIFLVLYVIVGCISYFQVLRKIPT